MNQNPDGTIPVSEMSKQISLTTGGAGSTGTMVTQISYINDPTPTSYATSANYKRITVTVRRNSDNKQLISSVTYVAPEQRAPYGGINNGIINANVTDAALSTPLQNATVNLASGPSAPLTDVTGATGVVTFPVLTPTTGAQPYYDVTATLAGYDTMPEDLPPNAPARFALAPSQTKNTGIRLFKPATIYVNVPNFAQGVPPGTCVAPGFWVYIASSRKAAARRLPMRGRHAHDHHDQRREDHPRPLLHGGRDEGSQPGAVALLRTVHDRDSARRLPEHPLDDVHHDPRRGSRQQLADRPGAQER